MMVYRRKHSRKHSQPFRWLLAMIVFILAMTVTFADVYGQSGCNF